MSYLFLHKVNVAYHRLAPHGHLHANRHTKITKACSNVLHSLPATKMPYGGDVKAAVKSLLPILEELYQMPSLFDDEVDE